MNNTPTKQKGNMKKTGRLVGVCNCQCHCTLEECFTKHDTDCKHCKNRTLVQKGNMENRVIKTAKIDFPYLIKKVRQYFNETQTVFGKRFGVSHASVSEWESGKSEASYKVLNFVLITSNGRYDFEQPEKQEIEKLRTFYFSKENEVRNKLNEVIEAVNKLLKE